MNGFRLTATLIVTLFSPSIFCQLPNSSAGFIPPITNPATILLIESGFISWPPLNTATNTFSTTKSCPATFRKYFELVPSKVLGDNERVMHAFGACVSSVTGAGPYTVTYKTVIRYSAMDNEDYDDPIYASSNADFYFPYSIALPSSIAGFEDIYRAHYVSLGGIHWKLYCYPPSINPPNETTGCLGSPFT